MNKFSCYMVFLLVLVSCDDDNPCDGVTVDVLTQFLYVEILDVNGNNLIQNGTYSLDEVFTERNGNRFPAVIYTGEASFIDPSLQYKIEIGVVGDASSNNIWTVDLSDDETDTLRMDLSILSQGCSGTFYQINEIEYNNEILPVQNLDENRFQVQVIK
ncbi:hypothetical protein GTQ34_08225 [Muricauda sp. JGD-17]|uniref:Uncharacterized protein n=1 Tax=Flagellimonas ochracea TaxID=2696472 RepID=A0A964WX96_9FLAO|nr:hypothetical protein [Allomuricauda ochracea]NAY91901.1 hypothetical protein [Allomuricauda ochracea]